MYALMTCNRCVWRVGVPNYPEIITEPMDLGTIKKRMTSSRYESHEQWADDIQKVWSNAMSFNAPGDFLRLPKNDDVCF